MDRNSTETKLHSGKWTLEEEAYVEGLMEEFRAGTLDLQEGTTLRSFLAQKLNCKPKRISKKYEGKNYDGKQLFWKTEEDISPAELRMRRAKLQRLETRFKECLKAMEIAKASRQSFPTGATGAHTLGEGHDHSVAMSSAAEAKETDLLDRAIGSPASAYSMGSLFLQGSAHMPVSLPLPPAAAAGTGFSDLYRGSSADTSLLLARQRQLQAMESLARANAGFPQQPSRLGSFFASAPDAALLEAAAAARQDAALFEAAAGFGGLQRPASPSAFGTASGGRFNFNQPPSPQANPFLGQTSAWEQARFAAAMRNNSGAYSGAAATTASSFRPSINSMLASRLGRQTSGNRQAQAAYEESMLRLQQPVRDLGSLRDQARRLPNDQGKEPEESKRSLDGNAADGEQQQNKRQRFS